MKVFFTNHFQRQVKQLTIYSKTDKENLTERELEYHLDKTLEQMPNS